MKKYVDGKYIEMTSEEVSERESQITADVAFTKTITDAMAKIETDKASGKKKLKDLGLTDDEIKALMGVE
tara:strand:+ start:807 stop:1016 length:210 start_codon:yes stop_codon:yes gene_type:complete